ncbi:isochorismate synthase [Kineococcus xinjiangensis]|uniref:isochorismate synthase n=1 Tax=Kineococcus xinjiangensis TaxID=512762 RepID=A0A2S6ITV0_9ACTN|nr:isochorismate synthase [Kineococcus xinjiangensis]PPK97648.1 isochorismate synthase [Kineococcus xinjiangensis]
MSSPGGPAGRGGGVLPPQVTAALERDAAVLVSPEELLVGARRTPVAGRSGREQLAGLAQELAAAPAGSLAIGAVPFDPAAPGALAIATDVLRLPRSHRRGAAVPPSVPGGGGLQVLRSTPRPSPEEHRQAVADAVRRIAAGDLAKVVLARSVDVRLRNAPAVADVVERLAAANPTARVLAVPLPAPAGTWLVGATPELLVRRRGREVVSVPLAGSQPRSSDPAVDATRAARLVGSDKDRREHDFVVEAIVEALRPLCTEVRAPAPELLATPAVWHLATTITGRLRDPATTSADLVAALHPTPAVAGTPRDAAVALIAELEGFDRGCYAGAIGWQDGAGDGEWSVGVRCAELAGNRLRLFAGGGIVAGSDPEAELAETSAKLRTVLDALGIEAGVASGRGSVAGSGGTGRAVG